MNDRDPCDDEQQADDGWHVGHLFVDQTAGDGHKDDSQSGPDTISDPDRDLAQAKAQQGEGSGIGNHRDG